MRDEDILRSWVAVCLNGRLADTKILLRECAEQKMERVLVTSPKHLLQPMTQFSADIDAAVDKLLSYASAEG